MRVSSRRYLLIILLNIGVVAIVESDVVLGLANRLTFQPVPPATAPPGNSEITYGGGYPGGGDGLATILLPFNLLLQYLSVRRAAASLSPRLARNRRFVSGLWQKVFYWGLPLLGIVFIYDFVTCVAFVGGSWFDVFVLIWFPYCYVAALLSGRAIVRQKAVATMRLCPHCRYCLRGVTSPKCPECGMGIEAIA